MHSASFQAAIPRASSYADDRTTRALLMCGTLAGPVFVLVGLIQSFTIPGFDLTHHYLSQLSSGDLGWIQIANFVVAGLLTIAAAVGVRRALAGGPLGRVAPVLLGGFGVSRPQACSLPTRRSGFLRGRRMRSRRSRPGTACCTGWRRSSRSVCWSVRASR